MALAVYAPNSLESGEMHDLYLIFCIYELVLDSQLPHKIVTLLFTITNQNMKLIVLWGS